MNSFYIRHTEKLSVLNEDVEELWRKNLIAVHCPMSTKRDFTTLDLTRYDGYERVTMNCLLELANTGGYVWADYRTAHPRAKVGKVEPGSRVLIRNATWSKSRHRMYARREGKTAKLKAVQLTDVKVIEPWEQPALRACRPRLGTIHHWWRAGDRLEAIVEGRRFWHKWTDLSPDMQETLCVEFLRARHGPRFPVLNRLLMPFGRTAQDVDLCGLTADGHRLFAQVTNYSIEDKEALDKADRLRAYRGRRNVLLFFCACDLAEARDGLTYVPVNRVWEWARSQRTYMKAMTS